VSLLGQGSKSSVSGQLIKSGSNEPVMFAHVVALKSVDSTFVLGVIGDESGLFTIENLPQGDYLLNVSAIGFQDSYVNFRVGRLSPVLYLGNISLNAQSFDLETLVIEGKREEVSLGLEKKNYAVGDNLSQLGGSLLEAMRNLPGVTVDRSGKLILRGSDKVIILTDGKQNALTGFANQQALDNIPASSIERIEIINNPSAKYDASGMAGVINIIFKKNKEEGWKGRLGLTTGIGGLWQKRENISATTRDQYRYTPKFNPTGSFSYKKDKINWITTGDLLLQKAMVKNEFITRKTSELTVEQQFLENRNQPIINLQSGLDIELNKSNKLNITALYNNRAYVDRGDLPFINQANGQQLRLWQYVEDEVNETMVATLGHQYQFVQPGRLLKTSFSYSYRKKDETFNFENRRPNFLGTDTFFLSAAENVYEFNSDYIQPHSKGRMEFGTKQRLRVFPNEVSFLPGLNTIMDPSLAGYAEYQELLSAFYANYIYEKKNLEVEGGLRFEYAKVDYLVDENHSVYSSSGFDYYGLFPNLRTTFLLSKADNLSIFLSRRVDRPAENNLRSFPTYADPEILRIGNPRLQPQFSNNIEAAYRHTSKNGFVYTAIYGRFTNNVMTTIISKFPNSSLLTSIDQNAGKARNIGIEFVTSRSFTKKIKLDLNSNIYQNVIAAFTIDQSYPSNEKLSFLKRSATSGNVKLNADISLPRSLKMQTTIIYQAPDIIPQGKIGSRYSMDIGLKKSVSKGKGEVFASVTDIFNTLQVISEINTPDLEYTAVDLYETQVVRVGFQWRF
jgi:outer membrane receptor protein involved in Fe transport